MMATSPFICDVQDPEESLKVSVDKQKARHAQVFSGVFVAVLMLLVMGLTGYIAWIKVSQQDDSQSLIVTAKFTGNNTNFTATRTGRYLIHGEIFKVEETAADDCIESFLLQQKSGNSIKEITSGRFCQHEAHFVVDNVELVKGDQLIIKLNCNDIKIIEAKSFLKVYRQNLGLLKLV